MFILTKNFQQYNELESVKSQGIPTSEMSDNEKSFGSLSPINLTPQKPHSSSKNDWSCESMKSIYNSTPECSVVSNYLKTSTNSMSILDDTKEKSFTGNDIAMADMDLTMFSMTDDEKQFSYIRTPSRRTHRYASRKNLSHSFSCLDDLDGDAIKPTNILSKTDSGFNETDDKTTNNDAKWPVKHSIQCMDVDAGSPTSVKLQ